MTKTEQRIQQINQQGYGYRIIEAGPGWSTPYLIKDKQSGLCQPIGHYGIYYIALDQELTVEKPYRA
jgi:hypothetical protein